MKTCKTCQTEQTEESFRLVRGDLRRIVCSECENKKNREYEKKRARPATHKDWHVQNYAGNKLKWRERQLLKDYGITLKQFDEMRVAQGFSCKLCGLHEETQSRGLFVDHCHDTGKVRGLLCLGCNAGLGMLGDNEAGLKRALKYLKGNL